MKKKNCIYSLKLNRIKIKKGWVQTKASHEEFYVKTYAKKHRFGTFRGGERILK